jgi:Tol biopolymer transport system component
MSRNSETPTDWRDRQIIVHAPAIEATSIYGPSTRTLARVRRSAKTGFNETDARRSPDGGWLAYVSDESGQPDVYAARWPGGARVRVSFAGGTRPRWSRDGRAVFFLRGSQLLRADLSAIRIHDTTTGSRRSRIRVLRRAHRRDACSR